VATGVKKSIAGRLMYNFFSISGVYIANRGQFLIPYFVYFLRILDRSRGGGGNPWFSCLLVFVNLVPGGATLACGRGGGKSQFGRGDRHCGSIGRYVLCGTASLENLPNTFCKKSAKN
jgi:hypothetical protein